jgi:hypothetical protein
MSVLRLTLPLALCLALAAHAQAECDDAFLECKDDCVVEFGGSVRVEMKKRYEKCMKKCVKVANRCTERSLETKNNALDEGALDGTVTSDQVDKDNLPTRTAGKKKRAPEARTAEDDAADEPVKPKEALRAEEVPRSSRTTLKVEDAPLPAKDDSRREEPVARKEEPPRREDAAPKASRRDDEELRDDRPRAEAPKKRIEEEPPPPKKREEPPKEPPKKKEEDHDDLRYY